jgi:hypothetical protein
LNSKKIATLTLLGTVAFISSGFLPSPIDKMVIGIQSLSFALASLIVPKGGATFASLITGLLLSALRVSFFPFSLIFSLVYGILIDGLFYLFKVQEKSIIKSKRLIILLAVATGITGVASMYFTTLLNVIPMVPTLYIAILIGATINGIIAGYLVLIIWKRYLSNQFQ